jgi:serine/threonine-protein kinase HipA
VSGQNDFALLDRLGGECAGAVTLLEPGNSPNPAGEGEIEWLSDEAVIALLDELPHRPMLAGREGRRPGQIAGSGRR